MGCDGLRWAAMGCDAPRTLKIAAKWSISSHRVAGPIGPATRCNVAHLRCGLPKPLRCRKIACDALRCKFQHVGNFAPDIGISHLFIVQFPSGFQAMEIAGGNGNLPS